jgi:hypothetical protein
MNMAMRWGEQAMLYFSIAGASAAIHASPPAAEGATAASAADMS